MSLCRGNYNLFLDDIRFPPEFSNKKYIIVRNYEDFCYQIKTFGIPEYISFDHDLGLSFIDAHLITNNIPEKTGYDCVKWLINYLENNNCSIQINFEVHSMNPVGKRNITKALDDWNNKIGET